jgi:hypothetical protein
MTFLRTPLTAAVACVAAIGLAFGTASCGSDEPAASSLPEPADTAAEQPIDAEVPADAGTVIGTANLNGTVVDPQPHPIDGFVIAESYPEQIQITFTGGDANCTAADARAVADGDIVRIELEVGITEDALTRSCVAAEFIHTMNIALTEGLDGRTVSAGA